MSDWKEIKIGEAVDIFTGFAFKGDQYESTGQLKVVRGENVTIGKLRWDSEKHWNKSTEGLERYFLKENDIVIGMDGSRVGNNRAIINKNELPLILAQRVACLRKKNGYDQKFIWYNIFSDAFKDYVEAIHTGTSIPHISQKQIADFILLCPLNENEQKAIATILSCLDDKIDLLQRQNATLEAMAETLFRQWFVEEAKEEWKEGKISDFGEVITGKTPSKENSNYWGDKFDFVTPTDFKDFGMFANNTARSLSELGWSKMKSLQIPEQSILVTCIGSDMGKVAISSKKCITNQQLNTVIVKNEKHLGFLFEYIKSQYQNIRNIAFGGTTMPIINKTDFSNIPIPIPPDETIELFNNHWKPLSNKILKNQTQIRTLATLRDTLLPKLMSGEARVVV